MNQNIFGLSQDFLTEKGALQTAREIAGQPDLWHKTFLLAQDKKFILEHFITELCQKKELQIILCGAGTSAFIGNCLEGIFFKRTNCSVQAISTTDLVTHPGNYFHTQKPTLLISFSRSGSSPESQAAIDLANTLCDNIHHLIVTCNAKGELAKNAVGENYLVLELPPESHDQGLAMTGSFSSMLLTVLLLLHLAEFESLKTSIDTLCNYGRRIIDTYSAPLRKVCELSFERAVFLGSGPLKGCAEECHLKLQELTDGRVISKFDSFLGFRHGPKAVITPETLMVYLFSPDPYVMQYELDLLRSIESGLRGMFSIGVVTDDNPAFTFDCKILLNEKGAARLDSDFLPVCDVVVGQLLGFFKSLQLGLTPDNPSASGTITRVVQGVTIYPYNNQ